MLAAEALSHDVPMTFGALLTSGSKTWRLLVGLGRAGGGFHQDHVPLEVSTHHYALLTRAADEPEGLLSPSPKPAGAIHQIVEEYSSF